MFRIIQRQLWKNRVYAIINISGLTAGIVCVLFAVLFWKDEASFDNFHKQKSNIFRVTTGMKDQNSRQLIWSSGTGQVQAEAFKKDIPEIRQAVRLLGGQINSDISGGNNAVTASTLFADKNFFEIFSFRILKGDSKTPLDRVDNAVISASTAKKLFNSIDVIGKPLSFDADPSAQKLGKPMIITAVVEDPAPNSSIQFDVLLPFSFLQLSFEDNSWHNNYLGTYLLMHPSANIKLVEKKLKNVYLKYGKEQRQSNITSYTFDPAVEYQLQPLSAIHLGTVGKMTPSSEAGIVSETRPLYSWIFIGIAGFILLMSCINFINISIAGSLKRAKEVGIRKISGGSRGGIILQFLAESALLCVAAFVVAAFLIAILLPWFNNLTAKSITLTDFLDPSTLVLLLCIMVVTIALSGLYPAFALSKFSPVEVLYQRIRLTGKNILGRGLIVFQVAIGAFLLIATLVYFQQMNFVRTRHLGYDPELVLVSSIKGNRDVNQVARRLQSEIVNNPSFGMISFGGGQQLYNVSSNKGNTEAVHHVIDENYLPLLKIPILAGRNLDPKQFPSDSNSAVIVNESFVKANGIQDPLGQLITTDSLFDKHKKTIVGVVKDFHSGSLRETIRPTVYFMNNWYGGEILLKLKKTDIESGLRAFESIYKRTIPGSVYSYSFMDEMNRKQYQEEERWEKIITAAAIISIVICCMGLFGLAHLATSQRTREIGIHKVLGATIYQLVVLQSSGFMKLVALAFLIAMPVAWMVMNNWLEHFAYRITIGTMLMSIAAILLSAMAVLTVGWQSFRAARSNLANAIRL